MYSVNIFTRKRVLLLAALLICVLCLGSLLLTARQQGNAKTSTTRNSETFDGILATAGTALPTLFSDNFSDNSQNWNVGNDAMHGSSVDDGTLTMMATNHKPFREPLPSDTVYDDFAVATSVTILQGDQNDSVGLYLRANGTTRQGYAIDINGDDTFDIAKNTVDANQKNHTTYLVKPQHASALHTKGQKNNLLVIMKGSNIVLLINNTVVKLVQDRDFTSGRIMLFVANGTSSSGVTASFDTIAVYTAPEHLPS